MVNRRKLRKIPLTLFVALNKYKNKKKANTGNKAKEIVTSKMPVIRIIDKPVTIVAVLKPLPFVYGALLTK